MKIRDEMLQNAIADLKESYKVSKQEIGRIGKAMSGEADPIVLADLNYERGFNEGRLQTAGVMLNFFQDYNAKPLELTYDLSPEAPVNATQYDHLLQLAHHQLSAYAFERMKERQGEPIHGENLRNALQVMQVMTSVLEILDPGCNYKFFDGQGGNWTGIYSVPKDQENQKVEVVLKVEL